MPRLIDLLAPGATAEMPVLSRHFEPPEYHVPHRHLVDHSVEPVGQEHAVTRRRAVHLNHLPRENACDLRDDFRQRQRHLLKSLLLRVTYSTHADIGSMREMLGTSLEGHLFVRSPPCRRRCRGDT